jgi:hypothetical protein
MLTLNTPHTESVNSFFYLEREQGGGYQNIKFIVRNYRNNSQQK